MSGRGAGAQNCRDAVAGERAQNCLGGSRPVGAREGTAKSGGKTGLRLARAQGGQDRVQWRSTSRPQVVADFCDDFVRGSSRRVDRNDPSVRNYWTHLNQNTHTHACAHTQTLTHTHTHTLDWSQLMTRTCTRQPGLAVRRPGKDLISKVGGVDSDSDFWFLLLILQNLTIRISIGLTIRITMRLTIW
jgi:hypothetical protein